MAEKKTALWKLIVGYSAFGLFALVAGVLLTFPYDALSERVRLEADNAGYFLRIGSLGPGLLAVRAKNIDASKKAAEADGEKAPEPLRIDAISIGPTLFPPGLGVSVKALDGTVKLGLSGLSTVHVKVDAEDLDLSKGNVKGFSGIDLGGTVGLHVDLSIPKASVGSGEPEPDLGQASGTITLEAKNLVVNGGSVNVPIPQYGPEPTPIDLPKIAFGDITGKIKIEKGAGTVDELHVKSADMEMQGSGTLKFAKRLEYCEPNVEVRMKFDPEFQKRLGLLGSALSMIGADPKDPSWRLGRRTGYQGRPHIR